MQEVGGLAAARPVKRSVTLRGHRTSVSLEEDFWQAFQTLARHRGMSLNALAAEIDAERVATGADIGLASAIRVVVLRAALRGQQTELAEG